MGETRRGPIIDKRLLLDQRMIVLNGIRDSSSRRWFDDDALSAIDDLNRLGHFQERLRPSLRDQPGRLTEMDKGNRTAVHGGNFAAVDFDKNIIDSETSERSENVLNGFDRQTIHADRGAQF